MKVVGVLFGGQSGEHSVSLVSAVNLINSIDVSKYKIAPILIRENGEWVLFQSPSNKIKNVDELVEKGTISFEKLKEIVDVVFPVIHGETGEDGKIQGLLEMLKIPYVGCNVETSAIGMNKSIAKDLLAPFMNVAKGLKIRKKGNLAEQVTYIEGSLNYPVFVKPVRAGSSLGANKANNREELSRAIFEAFQVDNEILVEEFIKMIELEVALFEDSQGKTFVSEVGHIHYNTEFYDYEAKYVGDASEMIIPAKVDAAIIDLIKENALIVKECLNVKDYSRVDFFYDSKSNEVYFNEINTSPGMTSKSMYPFLFKNQFDFEYIVNELIEKNLI